MLSEEEKSCKLTVHANPTKLIGSMYQTLNTKLFNKTYFTQFLWMFETNCFQNGNFASGRLVTSVTDIIGKINDQHQNRAPCFCYVKLLSCYAKKKNLYYRIVYKISQNFHLPNKSSISDEFARKTKKSKF